MKVLSLFDGISCGMVALERAGVKVEKYAAYEIDVDAIKVSKSNYSFIEQKGDVFNAAYNKGEYDILLGGSPCTYWSIAKGSNGRETKSSGFGWELFMQYVRALKEVEPKYFLYENNFSMSEDIKEEITNKLGVQPIMIDSADFSAQIRKRYYWTNIPFEKEWLKSNLVLNDIIFEEEKEDIKSFEKYKETVRENKGIVKWDTSGKGYYSQQNRARSLHLKSNTLTASGSDKNNIWLGKYNYRKIKPIEAERLQTLPDDYTNILKSKNKRVSVCGNGWTVDVITHILKCLNKEV